MLFQKTNASRLWGVVLALACGVVAAAAGENWPSYHGDEAGTHYSKLTQITRSNIAGLKEAWRFVTPDPGPVQSTPLVVDGVMYVVTARQKIVALDATNGKVKWTFDSGIGTGNPTRGLAYWSDGRERRLFASVASYLYAIDAETGSSISSFGDQGKIDLRANLRGAPEDNVFAATTPPVVYKDLLIVGGRVAETTPASPGDERAYDVRTGAMRWSFRTVPEDGEPGAETWPAGARRSQGGANAWAGSIVDIKRGIVFIATGSPSDDFYGVNRPGDNLYSNCVIALDANTGKKLWHFQAVKHDLWDSDFAAPPVLLSVNRNGKRIDAVAATNKWGFIYVFDRVSGESLFPIIDKPVPKSSVPGEVTSPTQPFPQLPRPLARQTLERSEITGRTPALRDWARNEYDSFLGATQPFTPLSIDRPTLVAPGWKGGVEWGGITADPERGIIYANVNNAYSLGTLAEAASYRQSGQGERTYRAQCMICHGSERKGAPPAIPALVDIGSRLTAEQMTEVILRGRGRMVGFPSLSPSAVTNVISYLTSGRDAVADNSRRGGSAGANTKYVFTGYKYFTDPEGYPAGPTPWGTLSAVDLNTGSYLWTVPYGQYTELAAKGLKDTGSDSHGGTVLTATGVLFAGGSENDLKFRAYDSANGKMLWEGALPGHGVATPATYSVNGKQYVVIAASPRRSAGVDTNSGPSIDSATYVVFALP